MFCQNSMSCVNFLALTLWAMSLRWSLDFGEWFLASHRIHRPELAGGPMLDLGTYLISFVLDVVDRPTTSSHRVPRPAPG